MEMKHVNVILSFQSAVVYLIVNVFVVSARMLSVIDYASKIVVGASNFIKK